MIKSPIFIAGPDRSGTTLMYALLASHSNISMVRRTNMWRYFYQQYGDLSVPDNFERCLSHMVRYNRMRHLSPDPDQIRREFWQGEQTYGHLFSLFHRHHAERNGKDRWGDKSLHTEHYANHVFTEFPGARIIHMVRDPRDRYASVRKRWGKDTPRLGAATARWLDSIRVAQDNEKKYPDNYLIVRFEDLASRPDEMARSICAFIGEPFEAAMLDLHGASRHRESGGNSSFGQIKPGTISTKPVGRFRNVLTPSEIRFTQTFAGDSMNALGYQKEEVQLAGYKTIRYWLWILPVSLLRMIGWLMITSIRRKRGFQVPEHRLRDIDIGQPDHHSLQQGNSSNELKALER